ncbi:hypothetical protein [Streptomyces albogriseolus]|uniref:hypothetical protein n=1 Tax=Streptomyces albogriseolus TaxID=1887 RepID=UPI00345F2C1E
MDPVTPEERAEYARLRNQIERGFNRLNARMDHILGDHGFAPDGDCPSCEARQHPQT